MECYTNPWLFWRESRNFWFFIGPSFPHSLFVALFSLIIFVCALSFDQLKGGCGSITPLNIMNSLNQGFDKGNSLYQKLWTQLDNMEKCGLRSTKVIFNPSNFSIWIFEQSRAAEIKLEKDVRHFFIFRRKSFWTENTYERHERLDFKIEPKSYIMFSRLKRLGI